MTPATLITEHLDTWTSAIKAKSAAGRGSSKKQEFYGIKKLRELILELAVRGLLTERQLSDQNDRNWMSFIKSFDKRVHSKEAEASQPFEIPNSWRWVCLNDIADYRAARKVDSENILPDSWLLDLEDLEKETGRIITFKKFHEVESKSTKASFTKGDVLYGKLRPYLNKVVVAPKDGFCTTEIVPIRVREPVTAEYLRLFLSSPPFVNYANSKSYGVKMPRLGTNDAENASIPLPPLAEQHRIVAKVDELMALCDQLERQQEDSVATHGTLVQTLLGALTAASESGQFDQAWQRIHAHFDTLFTTESSIDQLKQTILQLAVMGKLVEQDPKDEPASDLLVKIAKQRAKLVKEGKMKKQKPLPPVSDDETPFTLPAQWVWCKFGLIADFINGDRSKNYPHTSEYVPSGIPWINTGHIEPDGSLTKSSMNYITKEKFDTLRGGKVEPGDLVYCLRGATFGKTAFITPYSEGAIASSLMIIRPHIKELGSYIYRYLISPFGRSQIFRFDNGSAQPNLSANSVTIYAFPLPPLAEQQRIVAKVEELMTLCDRLKSSLQTTQTTQLYLADTLVEAAIYD